MSRHHLGLFLPTVIIALLGACATQPSPNPPGGSATAPVTVIDADRFEQMSRQPGVIILDVRTREEFAEGHIQGALNIDAGTPVFAEKVAPLDKNATYLVYCRSGRRSAQASEQLSAWGFTHLNNLNGGISAWTAGGKAVEK